MRHSLLTVIIAGAVAAGLASPAAAASGGRGHHATRTLCSVRRGSVRRGPRSRAADQPGAYVDGRRYWVQDDRFGTDDRQCLTLTPHGRAAFTVSVSRADNPGNTAEAFPYIQYGCYWGWCTPGSVLPLRVSALRSATSTWSTREHARGIWNAGYDLWLNSTRLARRHANRAEVMIWLNATTRHYRIRGPAGTRPVTVAGRRFYLTHWRTGTGTIRGGWEYVQYRLAGAPRRVRNLNLRAVLLDAARRHLISRSWYLQGVLAGNEIWRGGQGLATTRFSVTVTGRRHARR
ncbi:MAG: GH12 family glycosyl hydrolase domain-containing protein [Streptosporangiaceae bacterium]